MQALAAEAAQAAPPTPGSSAAVDAGAAAARHALEEARMLQLLAERAVLLEKAKVCAF